MLHVLYKSKEQGRNQLPSELQDTWNISQRMKFSLYSDIAWPHFSRMSWIHTLTSSSSLSAKKIVVCLRTKEILTFHLLLISSVLLPRFFKTVARSPQIFSRCSEQFWTWLSSLLCHGGADFPASPLSLRNKTNFLLFPVYLSLRTFLQQVLFVCDMTLWGVLCHLLLFVN